MEFIRNNKGGQKLCFEGFMYNQHIVKQNVIYWRCVERNSGCKGRLQTSSARENPHLTSNHNHNPDQRKIDIAKARCEMKGQAGRCEAKPSQIISKSITNVPVSSLVLLPSNDTLRRTIQNEKTKHFPAEPLDINDLSIDNTRFATTIAEDQNSEQFLLYDNRNQQGNRIICFSSTKQLQKLADARIWFLDGDFKMSPRNFEQVYFIKIKEGDHNVLAVSALLQRKTQETYEVLFRMIADKCEEFFGYAPSPELVMMDFEKAVNNAIILILGEGIVLKCCFYHLAQSTWRKIQDLGIIINFSKFTIIRSIILMLKLLLLVFIQ